MEEIKISFIVPIYNAEKYIEKCVRSILDQKYRNNEIILVDDGSRDSSNRIINNLASEFSNIRIIKQKNGGPSKARNAGLEIATGDYIAFVDADDYISKDFSLRMIEKSNGGLVDLVVCNYVEVEKSAECNVNIFKELKGSIVEGNNECLNEIISGPGGLVWGKLFRTEIIKKEKIKFDEQFKMCEDLLFCVEFIKDTKSVGQVLEHLYIYNKCNEQSITTKYDSNMFFLQLDIQHNIKNILKDNNLYNDYTKKMLINRTKNILQYSLYKECFSDVNKKLSKKLYNINKIINDSRVKKCSQEFIGDGPIDRKIVSAIKRRKPFNIYIYTMIRTFIVRIYSKIKAVN